MPVPVSDVMKEINGHVFHNPGEAQGLKPLFDALLDHSRQQLCCHDGRCPLITVGALLVDEQARVLMLRNGAGWGFAEDPPQPEDDSLARTALRVLEEFAGIYDVWTVPGAEGPFVIDVSPAEDESRLRFGFRYLFRAHSGALIPSMETAGRAQWRPLDQLDNFLLRERLLSHLVVSP
ncbi:NUDIX hydrolase [Streptomyces sp. NPDC088725]|uniref:NUDIX hydrolase n=1 Tax=Streptomyces sp. NPDC088725 TaxID=3365873 RepID=UPI00380759F5